MKANLVSLLTPSSKVCQKSGVNNINYHSKVFQSGIWLSFSPLFVWSVSLSSLVCPSVHLSACLSVCLPVCVITKHKRRRYINMHLHYQFDRRQLHQWQQLCSACHCNSFRNHFKEKTQTPEFRQLLQSHNINCSCLCFHVHSYAITIDLGKVN